MENMGRSVRGCFVAPAPQAAVGQLQLALGKARKRGNYDEIAKPLVEVQLV
jgi:hypothetical protein